MWYFFHVDALSWFWKQLKDRKWTIIMIIIVIIVILMKKKEKDFEVGNKREVDEVVLHPMY